MDEKTINNNETPIKPEGERLTDFLTSMFYDVKYQKFSLTGLQVALLNNGSHKIEITIEGIKESIK